MPMDIRKIKKLIDLLEASGVAEIEIKEGEDSVRITRHPQPVPYTHLDVYKRQVAGLLAALLGQNIQAWFQNPWVLGLFSALFVLLALSMFGLYELQLPLSLIHI